MHLLTAQDYRFALGACVGIFGMLAAGVMMTTKSLTPLTDLTTLAVIAVVSVGATIADLVIKQKRREKGVTDEVLMRNVQADILAGRSAFSPLENPRIKVGLALVVGLITTLAAFYFGA